MRLLFVTGLSRRAVSRHIIAWLMADYSTGLRFVVRRTSPSRLSSDDASGREPVAVIDSDSDQSLVDVLKQWRRVLIRRRVRAAILRWLLVSLGAFIIGLLVRRVVGAELSLWPLIVVSAFLYIAGLWMVTRRSLTLFDTAMILDRHLQLHEQLATALELRVPDGATSPLAPYVQQRATQLAQHAWTRWLPVIDPGGQWRALAVLGVAALGVLVLPWPQQIAPTVHHNVASTVPVAIVSAPQSVPPASLPDQLAPEVHLSMSVVPDAGYPQNGATTPALNRAAVGRGATLSHQAGTGGQRTAAAGSTSSAQSRSGRGNLAPTANANHPNPAVNMLHNHLLPSALATGPSSSSSAAQASNGRIPILASNQPANTGTGNQKIVASAPNQRTDAAKRSAQQGTSAGLNGKSGSQGLHHDNATGTGQNGPESTRSASAVAAARNKTQNCLYRCANPGQAPTQQRESLQTTKGTGINSRSLTGSAAGSGAPGSKTATARQSEMTGKGQTVSLVNAYAGKMTVIPIRSGATASSQQSAGPTGADAGVSQTAHYVSPDSNVVLGADRGVVGGYFTPAIGNRSADLTNG